jgi:hypothetical protein
MPNGAPPAILVENQPRPPHRFNLSAVGGGEAYRNMSPDDNRCVIDIWAGPPGPMPLRPGLPPSVQVRCHVSTDTKPTIFQGDVAHQLKLSPAKPFTKFIDSCYKKPYVGFWSKHILWVAVGPAFMDLEVWFPVQQRGNALEWQLGFPAWNVLGTARVLDRRMLCVTSDHVFAFVRL